MTEIRSVMYKCAICKRRNTRVESASLDTLEIANITDLERRKYLFDFNLLAMCCSKCGYCASNIEEADNVKGIKQLLSFVEYEVILKNTTRPKTANGFICCAYLADIKSNSVEAAYYWLYAAWACDKDEYWKNAGIECRKRSAELFELVIEDNTIKIPPIEYSLLMIDIYQRIEDFTKAEEWRRKLMNEIYKYENKITSSFSLSNSKKEYTKKNNKEDKNDLEAKGEDIKERVSRIKSKLEEKLYDWFGE
jgi:hypothetical protein